MALSLCVFFFYCHRGFYKLSYWFSLLWTDVVCSTYDQCSAIAQWNRERESLLCCTWQLMESRNLRNVIENFLFKFSSWERWQLPVSWLVLMKIGKELQDVHELNVTNNVFEIW